MHISSLRQPGYPFYFWTRGFASPDYSGFARSENVVSTIIATEVLFTKLPQKKATLFLLSKMSSDFDYIQGVFDRTICPLD